MENPSWKDKLTTSLLTVPDTFWISLFNKISFEDIQALLDEDSGFRDTLVVILRDDPIYMKQIEKNIILECIEDLEREVDIEFRRDLRDFFVQRGFVGLDPNDEKNYSRYKRIVNEYLDTLIDMYRKNKYDNFRQEYIDSEIEKLEKRKLEKRVPFDLIENYKHRSFQKFQDFNEVSKKYRRKIEKIDDIELKNFMNNLFYQKNTYQNVKEYLEIIKKSMDKKYHPYLLDCIEYRLSAVKEKLKDKK
jgi:hypothetical protein